MKKIYYTAITLFLLSCATLAQTATQNSEITVLPLEFSATPSLPIIVNINDTSTVTYTVKNNINGQGFYLTPTITNANPDAATITVQAASSNPCTYFSNQFYIGPGATCNIGMSIEGEDEASLVSGSLSLFYDSREPLATNFTYTVAGSDDEWSSTDGPHGTGVSELAASSPEVFLQIEKSATDILYATTEAGSIFSSTNGGTSWTNITSGGIPSNPIFFDIAIGESPNPVYISLQNSANDEYAVYRRSGSSWQNITASTVLEDVEVAQLLFTLGNLYAATDVGVFIYTNQGWEDLEAPIANYISLSSFVLDAGNEFLYAGTTIEGIYSYSINDDLWTDINDTVTEDLSVTSITTTNTEGDVYLGSAGDGGGNDKGVWVCEDPQAVTPEWTNISTSVLEEAIISDLAINLGDDLYAATIFGEVFGYNGDNEEPAWTLFNTDNNPDVTVIAAAEDLYAGTVGDGVFEAEAANDWTSRDNPNFVLHYTIFGLTTDSTGTLYAGSDQVGVSVYLNNAWFEINNNLLTLAGPSPTAFSLAVDSSNRVYAGVNRDGGIFRFQSGVWTDISGVSLDDQTVNKLAMTPTNVLYAGTADEGVFRSLDPGAPTPSWTNISSSELADAEILSLVLDSENILYAGTSEDGVFKWENNTWTALGSFTAPVSALAVDNNDVLYASVGMPAEVFKYNGTTWDEISAAPLPDTVIFGMAFNDSNTLFVGTLQDGVFSYQNGTWTDVSGTELADTGVYSLLFSDDTLYAGTATQGVFVQ